MSIYGQWKMISCTLTSATCPDTARSISALWLECIIIPGVDVAVAYYAAWQRDRHARALLYCGFRAARDIMAGIAAIPDFSLMREVLCEKIKWVTDVTLRSTYTTAARAYILRPNADTLCVMTGYRYTLNFTDVYAYLQNHPEEDPAFIREAERQIKMHARHLYLIEDD